ncbi:MAG: replication initiator protein A [Lachnospiraceae bacterium]|nr:replication initiator protein A [Lachnospiraceae bacterium]
MHFQYFYDSPKGRYTFYRIPKQLFSDKCFSTLSADAKLLYGILLDRMELSVQNDWKDSIGRIYIYYPVEEIKRTFCCSNDKAVRMLGELDSTKGIGPVEVVRQGQGKPNRIYVRQLSEDTFQTEQTR